MKKYLPPLIALSLSMGGFAALVPMASAHVFSGANQPAGIHRGRGFDMGTKLLEMSKLIGITADELKAKLEGGKTMKEILEGAGIKPEQLKESLQEQMKAHLQEQVASEKITQAEADKRQERMENRIIKKPTNFKMRKGGFKRHMKHSQ